MDIRSCYRKLTNELHELTTGPNARIDYLTTNKNKQIGFNRTVEKSLKYISSSNKEYPVTNEGIISSFCLVKSKGKKPECTQQVAPADMKSG